MRQVVQRRPERAKSAGEQSYETRQLYIHGCRVPASDLPWRPMPDDLYTVLGVPKSADAATLKKAYRKLAKELHPDKNPGNKATETRFKSVNHAFEVLGDAKKRGVYDEFGEDGLREGFDPERARAYKNWEGQGGQRGDPRARTVSFEDLFGNAGGGGGGGGGFDGISDLFGRQRRRGPQRGSDVEAQIEIDFASAVRGSTLDLSVGGKPVTVRIPAGADEGSRVRIAGQGGASPNGGASGDLFLTIHVKSHPHFRREGDDLHLDLPVTVKEAFAGAKVRVPTIAGAVQLKVPTGTQSGHALRLRGKGVQRKGRDAGDLYVHFLVKLPVSEDPELTKLVDAIEKFQTDDPRVGIEL
jgi:curved DNA-binding protein